MAQINTLVGDVKGNTALIIKKIKEAQTLYTPDLIAFPELTITGYPPEDLLLRPDLHQHVEHALTQIAPHTKGLSAIVGYPQLVGKHIYNAAAYFNDGTLISKYYKQCLPNYGVFDEKRYFKSGDKPCIVKLKETNIGIIICEDAWEQEPAKQAKDAGAELIVSINASPFDLFKSRDRENIVLNRVKENHIPFIYVASVGGQDEVVFDGGSFATNRNGEIQVHSGYYQTALTPVYIENKILQKGFFAPPLSDIENVYKAITLGIKDYVTKNGAKGAVLGLSGGIDSALVVCLAVDALGAENVETVLLPSRYTSQMSLDDATTLADNLNVKHSTISIEPTFNAFVNTLTQEFDGYAEDTTEENIQARCRGVILMAISNKKGLLVLTTSNKSETAVGYSTLYGDMAGGFAPIKDVPKTMVYELCRYRNQLSPVIPDRILTRPPSAELRHEQTDQDTLPDYEVLDAILEKYVERDYSLDDIVALGFPYDTVKKILAMVDRNEYKRRQAAPGIRITKRAFGRERRYPITSGFRCEE